MESCKKPDQKVTPPFLLHLCTKMQISRSVMVGSSKFLVICKALNLLFRLSTTFIRQIITYLPASAKTCAKGVDHPYTDGLVGVRRQRVKGGGVGRRPIFPGTGICTPKCHFEVFPPSFKGGSGSSYYGWNTSKVSPD